MPLIFIRHAEKEYENGHGPAGCYQHDPHITQTAEELADRGHYLRTKYGRPEICFVSPYLRTRETLAGLEPNASVQIEPLLGEFLGNQRKTDVDPTTCQFALPPAGETMIQLRQRCRLFLDSVKEIEGIAWIVTHGLVISTIAKMCGRAVHRVQNLDGIIIDEGQVRWKNL